MNNTSLDNIRIVLVETSHPGNIGAVARAMKNMGLRNLCLVNPKKFPAEEALMRAASAADILDNTQVCNDVATAIGDARLVLGASARERRIPWPVHDPRAAANQAINEAMQHDVAILFGREDRGLKNEELQQCHLHINIPTDDTYSSLNLAMAVQVVCYELRMAWLATNERKDTDQPWDAPLATAADAERFFAHLEQTLITLDFLKPSAPRQLMTRLRRLFTRIRMDEMELNILRGILTAAQHAAGKKPE
ncbi:MAG: tRNA (cytosine(32)/uridine(32)-2'-O)-methyltransferase TrmJ [Pseudomonadales bacterium]